MLPVLPHSHPLLLPPSSLPAHSSASSLPTHQRCFPLPDLTRRSTRASSSTSSAAATWRLASPWKLPCSVLNQRLRACRLTKASRVWSGGVRASAVPASEAEPEVWEAKQSVADYPYARLLAGVAGMLGAERATAAALKSSGSSLPSAVLLLAIIAAYMAAGGQSAADLYDWMHPAIAFFDQWMPLFFVPSISAIALAPLPHGLDLLKSALLLGSSYLLTLWASTRVAAYALKYLQALNLRPKASPLASGGQLSDAEKMSRIKDAANAWTRKAAQTSARVLATAALQSDDQKVQKFAVRGAAILSKLADSVPAPARAHVLPSIPGYTPAMLYAAALSLLLPGALASQPSPAVLLPGLFLLSIALFNSARGIPDAVKKWVGPTLAAGMGMCAAMAGYGVLKGMPWQSGIRLYSEGAGGLMALLIGPAVAALGFKVHSQRNLLQQHAPDLAITCLVMAILQFVATALLGRVIGAPALVVRSLLPAHTTLGMALGMGPLLNASPGLIVAGVTIAGTTGISTAQSLLDMWKVRDPTVRGLAVGIASHSLGTSALVATEPKSAAVSGLAFALKGALSVLFISLPGIRQALLLLATGSVTGA